MRLVDARDRIAQLILFDDWNEDAFEISSAAGTTYLSSIVWITVQKQATFGRFDFNCLSLWVAFS